MVMEAYLICYTQILTALLRKKYGFFSKKVLNIQPYRSYVTEITKSEKTVYMKFQFERSKSNSQALWVSFDTTNCLSGEICFQLEGITEEFIGKSVKCVKLEAIATNNINLQMITRISPYCIK